MELTKKERMKVLQTQKVLSGRVFNSEMLPKFGMCDLADVVGLQSLAHLFINYVPILYKSQMRDFHYNVVVKGDGSLTTRIDEKNCS